MATALELHEKQTVINLEEGFYKRKLFFLIRLDKCNDCHFIEEPGLNFSLNCEKCIQEALKSSGFKAITKNLDINQYKIIRREIPYENRNDEMKNDIKEKEGIYSEKINMYQGWIIDQISSENHKIIDAAQHGSLFDQKIKTEFVDVAFKNLEEQNVIKRDNVTGNYYLVSMKNETEEKEAKWNYYISYPGVIEKDTSQCATKKFKTLEDALTFVKTHNLMNYYIQRREMQ